MLSAKRKWSKEDIICLLEAWKREECLYVVDHQHYYDKLARSEAMERVKQTIAKKHPDVTQWELIKKFENLRITFNREAKKVRKSLKSGGGTNEVYRPSLWYFDMMKFIEKYCVSSKSLSPTRVQTTESSDNSLQNEIYEYSNIKSEIVDEVDDSLEISEPVFLSSQHESSHIPPSPLPSYAESTSPPPIPSSFTSAFTLAQSQPTCNLPPTPVPFTSSSFDSIPPVKRTRTDSESISSPISLWRLSPKLFSKTFSSRQGKRWFNIHRICSTQHGMPQEKKQID